jgi:hypothetical protein
VEERRVRGAVEHFYTVAAPGARARAVARAPLTIATDALQEISEAPAAMARALAAEALEAIAALEPARPLPRRAATPPASKKRPSLVRAEIDEASSRKGPS